MSLFNKKSFRWGLRQVMLLTCLLSIFALFVYSNHLGQKNYQLLYDQTEQLSRVVIRQAANSAYEAIVFEDNKGIERLINNLEKEEFILDATLYDNEGNLLYSSENNLALSELTGLNTPMAIASIGRHQLVEPITKEGKLSGFLRITLEHGKIINAASSGLNQNINLIQSMLLFALFAGAMLIMILSKRLERWLIPFSSRDS